MSIATAVARVAELEQVLGQTAAAPQQPATQATSFDQQLQQASATAAVPATQSTGGDGPFKAEARSAPAEPQRLA